MAKLLNSGICFHGLSLAGDGERSGIDGSDGILGRLKGTPGMEAGNGGSETFGMLGIGGIA